MNQKEIGLYQKYHVRKLNNPLKTVDAIVLEFDDPIARVGILAWAIEMKKNGYKTCALEAINKVREFDKKEQKS